MNNFFNSLYSRFLFRKLNLDEFRELKHNLNKTSDDELKEMMGTAWEENHSLPLMNQRAKTQVKGNLSFYIQSEMKRTRQLFWLKRVVAASLLLVVSLGVWQMSVSGLPEQKPFFVEVKSGDKAQLVLPDGSAVKLNSASSLTYDFSDRSVRKVSLTGEAFFEVSKDKSKPFIVQVGELNIEVLGTSFNVSSYGEGNMIETSLLEGSIKLSGENLAHDYVLHPSEKAIYNRETKTIRIEPTDNGDETAWMQNRLVFDSEPLVSVIDKIERWYGVNIDLQCPEIAQDKISGSFSGEQLMYVMEALKMQYNVDYSINGNDVTIKMYKP
ncbi:MAG: FecR domain-containing protein [Porphyromonadaceae bacterium]|nr:FecR domain-containing protein [Porphyromonadaceae bacterium]